MEASSGVSALRCDLVIACDIPGLMAVAGVLDALRSAGMQIVHLAGVGGGGSLVAAIATASSASGADLYDVLGSAPDLRVGTAAAGVVLDANNPSFNPTMNYPGVEEWLSTALQSAGMLTFGDLLLDIDPYSATEHQRDYRLVLVARDHSLRRTVRLPWDFSTVFGLEPDTQDISESVVRAAMGGRPLTDSAGWPHFLTETVSFPIDLFDRRDLTPPRWPTFGILAPTAGTLEWAKLRRLNERNQARSILVLEDGADDRDRLYAAGRAAADKFLSGWDFEEYLTFPARVPSSRGDEADETADANSPAAPKKTVIRDYWTPDDKLGHRPYVDAIASFIRHPNTRPPFTIGVRAPWGAGKTSLMRMVQAELDPPHGQDGLAVAVPRAQADRPSHRVA